MKHRISYTSFCALSRSFADANIRLDDVYTHAYMYTHCKPTTVRPAATARHDRTTRLRSEILQAIRLSYLSGGKAVTFVSCVRLFSLPSLYSPLWLFLSLFFYCQPFPQRFNNLSKAVNREIDRRSSRKLLLRCIRLKVLFTCVSWNLFVRGTCFAAQCRPFDTRENPVEEIEQISTVCSVQGRKKIEIGQLRAPHVRKGIRAHVTF